MPTTTTRRETGNIPTSKLDRLVTIDELSSLLKTSKATIYHWCHRQIIPYYRMGRLSLFDPVEVEAWLETKRISPAGGDRHER